MKCKTFKNKLNDFMEDSLSCDMEDAMKKHMNDCFECRTLYAEKKSTDELFDEVFSAKDIEFKSSRYYIMKNIDKKKYKKNIANKLYYFVKRNKIKYSAVAAMFLISTMVLMYMTDSSHTNFKNVTLKSKRSNVISLVNNKISNREMDFQKTLQKQGVFGANIINNKKLILKQDDKDGKMYLQLLELNNDKLISKVDITKDFKKPINFDGKFIIKYADYNGDGNPDFAIGQQSLKDKYKYKFYTIKKNTIQKIKFEDNNIEGVFKSYKYSPLVKSNGINSLIIPVKNDENNIKERFYIWNKKTKSYYFERNLSKEDQFVYIPKLKKQKLNKQNKTEEKLIWEDSPNDKLSVSFNSNNINKDIIYVKNNVDDNRWGFSMSDTKKQISAKAITWIDDENIAIVIEVGTSKTIKNSYIYNFNLKNQKVVLIYKCPSTREKINNIKLVNDGYEYECIVYDDVKLEKQHKEKWLLPTNSSTPINASV